MVVALVFCGALALALSGAQAQGVALPKQVASFEVKGPAVATLAPSYPGSSSGALLLTTFHGIPFSHDPVYAVPELSAVLQGHAPNVTTLDSSMHWVNQLAPTPKDVVAAGHTLLLAAGGFLVPTKTPGSVDFLDVTDPGAPRRVKISEDKKGYFYHQAITADINKDGRADVLAARATQPLLIGKKAGELVWFEQPASGALDGEQPWAEHVLTPGPDVAFLFTDLDADGKDELIATQFFSAPELRVYWCDKDSWAECDSAEDIESRLIDGGADGPWFNLQRVDLDLDGKDELMVTSNRDDGLGALYAFSIPTDYRSGNWTKSVLASGYRPATGGTGKGAPGTARAFNPRKDDAGKKRPVIILSGDDAGTVDLLSPVSSEVGDFTYASARLCTSESKGTIGTVAVGDADGDGSAELFVPFFSDNRVEVYSFSD